MATETKPKNDMREDKATAWDMLTRFLGVSWGVFLVTGLPWSIWVTSTLYAREVRISRAENFVNSFPSFETSTHDALRLRIMSDVVALTTVGQDRVLEKIAALSATVNEMRLTLLRVELTRPIGTVGQTGATGATGPTGPSGDKP
jgi:hypothetical protein